MILESVTHSRNANMCHEYTIVNPTVRQIKNSTIGKSSNKKKVSGGDSPVDVDQLNIFHTFIYNAF